MRIVAPVFLIALAAGCKSLPQAAVLPVRHSLVRDQLILYSDFPLPPDHRLLDDLARQRHDQNRLLQLPLTEEPIHVYLFRSAETFQQYMRRHHPELPDRRAFFVETDTRLAVYAHWGDRMAEDLRHEVAHGYLHAAVPHLPLWLDEGLAEYFEVPRGQEGVNVPHVVQLRAAAQSGWQPDLARLEQISSVDQMAQMQYAEAWAWVHLLLSSEGPRRELLCAHLARLRAQGAAPPLSVEMRRLDDVRAEALVQHIARLPLHRETSAADELDGAAFRHDGI